MKPVGRKSKSRIVQWRTHEIDTTVGRNSCITTSVTPGELPGAQRLFLPRWIPSSPSASLANFTSQRLKEWDHCCTFSPCPGDAWGKSYEEEAPSFPLPAEGIGTGGKFWWFYQIVLPPAQSGQFRCLRTSGSVRPHFHPSLNRNPVSHTTFLETSQHLSSAWKLIWRETISKIKVTKNFGKKLLHVSSFYKRVLTASLLLAWIPTLLLPAPRICCRGSCADALCCTSRERVSCFSQARVIFKMCYGKYLNADNTEAF